MGKGEFAGLHLLCSSCIWVPFSFLFFFFIFFFAEAGSQFMRGKVRV